MNYYKYIGCYKDNTGYSQQYALKLVEGSDYNYDSCTQKALNNNADVFGLQYSETNNTMQCFIGDSNNDSNKQLHNAKQYGISDLELKTDLDNDFNFSSLNMQCGKLKNGNVYGGRNANALYATDLAIDLCNNNINISKVQSPSYYASNLSDYNNRFNTIINSLKKTYFNYTLSPTNNNTNLYIKDSNDLKKLNLEYAAMLVELQNNIQTVGKKIEREDSNIEQLKKDKNKFNNKLNKLYDSDNAAIGVLDDQKKHLHISIIENILLFILLIVSYMFYNKFNSIKKVTDVVAEDIKKTIKNIENV